MTTSEVFKHYLNHIKDTCTDTTATTYKHKLNTVLKLLGDVDCNVITTVQAQELFDSLGDKYKSKTIRGLYDVTNAAFRYAEAEGLVKRNPFLHVNVGKVICHNATVLDSNAVSDFVASASNNPSLYLPILIATETGLRRSQVLALTWNDIDFSGAKISVTKNVVSSKKRIFTEGKEHQKRDVQMSSYLSEVLLGVKNYRRSIGVGVEADDYICLTSTNKPMEPTYFNRLFREFVNKSDMPDGMRFHDLRWSFIRCEVDKGTDPMTIANKVGHKSCVFTMDYYYRFHNKVA